MKKVLFVATVTNHINSFHIPYLKLFKDNGYEVHVATDDDVSIEYCDKHYKIDIRRNPFKLNNLKAIAQLKKIIDEEKYEVIHCHTPMGSVVTRLAAKHARKNGTRVIYTAHGFHFFKGAPLINWILYYPIEKWLSKYTDTLITINQEDYELAKRKFKVKDIQLVHGVGIDEDKFKSEIIEDDKNKLREEIGINEEDFVLIYVAELSKRKNQGMLISAMSELIKENSKIKLLLVGKDSLNGVYQKQVKKLGLQENVKFLGFRSDIPKLLKISHLVVSTSRQEGLPVNIMEAMSIGLPIIVTNCRGNRDMIKNEVNGYVVELGDVDLLKSRIEDLIKNEKNRIRFIEEGKKKIEGLNIDIIMNDMKKIYEL